MKAPDKIYVHEASAPELAEPALKEYHVEYIRKDALLEWAKEKANDYKGTANIRRSFEMMINKIESL